MTKYIVSGYIGFDNFGDELIARVLTDKLKSEGAEEITLISSNPVITAKRYGVKSCNMLKFWNSLKNSDILISGGGSLLQDVTSLKSLIYYLLVIYSAIILRKKVIIYAQGIGPINSLIGKVLTKYALKRAEKISVRDTKSQELLRSWGVCSELVNDPVLDLKFECKNKTGTVGVQLRNCAGLNEIFLNNLANEVSKRFVDKKIEVISLQDSADSKICHEFQNMLKARGIENAVVCEKLELDDVIEHITNLEYLVSMRFHACVVGIKSGIKTLAINYDPKVEKLAKEYKIPIISFDDNDLSSSFDSLINI